MRESDANVVLLLDFILRRCAQERLPTMAELRQFHPYGPAGQPPRSRAAVARDLERARQLGVRVYATRMGKNWVYQIHNNTLSCNRILDAARLIRHLNELLTAGFGETESRGNREKAQSKGSYHQVPYK
jgi:hypothetical protein